MLRILRCLLGARRDPLRFLAMSWGDQIRESCAVEDARRGVAQVEEQLVQGMVLSIAQRAQNVCLLEGGRRTVNQRDDLTDAEAVGIAAQFVAALSSAHALDDVAMLEFQQNRLQELFGQAFLFRDVANSDCAFIASGSKNHQSLQGVYSFLRKPNRANDFVASLPTKKVCGANNNKS